MQWQTKNVHICQKEKKHQILLQVPSHIFYGYSQPHLLQLFYEHNFLFFSGSKYAGIVIVIDINTMHTRCHTTQNHSYGLLVFRIKHISSITTVQYVEAIFICADALFVYPSFEYSFEHYFPFHRLRRPHHHNWCRCRFPSCPPPSQIALSLCRFAVDSHLLRVFSVFIHIHFTRNM